MKKLSYEKFLEEIVVIVDKQEKVNWWITNYFKREKIAFRVEHLKAGDYACLLNDNPLSIIIERKNSLTELSGNLATKAKKQRFYKEFTKVASCEKHLLIENDNLDNLITGLYGTDFHPNSYIANLILLQKRFQIQTHFINRYNMGLWILKLFYYHYYELL